MLLSPADMDAWVRDYEARDPTRWIVEVDPAEVERVAQWRHTKGTQRGALLADSLNADRMGALGELASSHRLGLPMPQLIEIGGDGGVDFRVRFPKREVTIDVKTRALGRDLLMVPTHKVTPRSADVLIMVQQLNDHQAQLMGWDLKSIIALETPRDFGYSCPTYARQVMQLRPMFQLEYLLGLRQP